LSRVKETSAVSSLNHRVRQKPVPDAQSEILKRPQRFDRLDFDVFSNQDWKLFDEIHCPDVVVSMPDGNEIHGIAFVSRNASIVNTRLNMSAEHRVSTVDRARYLNRTDDLRFTNRVRSLLDTTHQQATQARAATNVDSLAEGSPIARRCSRPRSGSRLPPLPCLQVA
jgi:hypothetical protein